MAEDWYDVIVVGAGIFGCNTAYQLLKHQCKKVLLIEKFHLPHTRGSSPGPSRALHNCHTFTEYVEMMPEVHNLWKQIEDEANQELLWRNIGEITVNVAETSIITSNMTKYGFSWELLNKEELRRKLPHINAPDDAVALWDPMAAIFNSGKCLTALQELIKKLGGTIIDGEAVEDITPGDEVEISTSKGKYRCKSLILTTGPWINDLMSKTGSSLPVQTPRGYHVYWKEKVKGTYSAKEKFPIYAQTFYFSGGFNTYYLMPSIEYPGMVKVGWKSMPPSMDGKVFHPDDRDANLSENITAFFKGAKEWIQKYIPGLEETPSIAEPCVYAVSPDFKFIIDFHPKHRNIMIGTAGSGNGFVMSPIVGKLLCQLALGHKPSYDLKPFKIARFSTVSKI